MYKENHYAFELYLPVWYKFLLKNSLLLWLLSFSFIFLTALWPTSIPISIYIKKWYLFPLNESTEYCMRLSKIPKYQLRNTFYWHAFLWYTIIFVSKMLVHIPSNKFQCHLILKNEFPRHYFQRYGVTLLGNRLLHLVSS